MPCAAHSRTLLMLLLFPLSGCAGAPAEPTEAWRGSPLTVQMQRLANVACPTPPIYPAIDGVWYVGCFGSVVAFEHGRVAVRANPRDPWPTDTQDLLLTICDGRIGEGIRGDGVVVGRCDELLICRYFPSRFADHDTPAVGDEAALDQAGSRTTKASWRREAW